MVINRQSKGVSYEAMVMSKNLNSFFEQESESKDEEE